MQQVFLKTCVAAAPRLLFLALVASACETPRDDLGPAHFEGAGRYVWPVDNRCAGRPGTLAFTAGPATGQMYESTLTVAP